MRQQLLNQNKPAAPTRAQPTKTSVKSQVHQEEELQAAIGNRAMGRLMETNRLPQPSNPFSKLQGELPLLGGMPVSQGTIQRQPLFRGLSQELNAEKGTLALPETGAIVQRKLTLGTPNDMYEQEADRVARQVVEEIHSSPFREQNALSEEERKPDGGEAGRVQRQITVRASGDAGGELSSEWEGQLQRAKSGGQPLSPSVKEPMERAFGADLGGVRVHTGTQADRLARSIQAKAFTTGQDMFFRQGAYEPGSRGGLELIAHELAHIKQQEMWRDEDEGGRAVRAETEGREEKRLPRVERRTTKMEKRASRTIAAKYAVELSDNEVIDSARNWYYGHRNIKGNEEANETSFYKFIDRRAGLSHLVVLDKREGNVNWMPEWERANNPIKFRREWMMEKQVKEMIPGMLLPMIAGSVQAVWGASTTVVDYWVVVGLAVIASGLDMYNVRRTLRDEWEWFKKHKKEICIRLGIMLLKQLIRWGWLIVGPLSIGAEEKVATYEDLQKLGILEKIIILLGMSAALYILSAFIERYEMGLYMREQVRRANDDELMLRIIDEAGLIAEEIRYSARRIAGREEEIQLVVQ